MRSWLYAIEMRLPRNGIVKQCNSELGSVIHAKFFQKETPNLFSFFRLSACQKYLGPSLRVNFYVRSNLSFADK